MKRFVPMLALLLCLPLAARADEASRLAKSEELISLLHMDRLMTQLMDSVMQQSSALTQKVNGGTLTPERKAALDAFQKKVFAVLDAQVGWQVMKPEYAHMYAKTFSDADLDAILAFYKSPTGVSMIEKTPELTQEGIKIVQGKLAAVQPQVKQMLDDFIKSQAPPPTSSPSPSLGPVPSTPAPTTPKSTPK